MPEAQPIQSNFTGGEISPRLFGRVDLDKYQHSLSLVKNFRVIPHGGLQRRPGTRFVATVKNSADGPVHLIPFSFSDSQEYVIEVGNFYFRFYTLNGQLVSQVASPTVIQGAAPIVPFPDSGSTVGVSRNTAFVHVPRDNARLYSQPLPPSPVELATPYAIADVFGISYAQKADTMYLFHKNYPVQKLVRTSASTFSLTQIDFNDGPYYQLGSSTQLPGVTGITITPSGTTGSITLTASAGIFDPAHVGSQWRIKDATAWGWVKVTGFTDANHVTATVMPASNNGAAGVLDGTAATLAWREGMISGVSGYPRTGLFHQSRLWLGGIPNTPASMVGSQTGDFENMSDSKSDGTVLDTSAVNYTVSSDKLNVIQWMRPSRNMIIGTSGAEHEAVGGSSSTPAITPTNILVRGQTTYGSGANELVLRVTNAILFVERNKRKVRELAYNFNTDSYEAPDISILAEHLFPPSTAITDNAIQPSFDQTVWMTRSDGVLLGCAYERTENVVGWFQFITGQGPINNLPHDYVESVTAINHPDGDRHQVWVAVARNINGQIVRFIEFIDDKFNPYHTLQSPQVPLYQYLNTDAAATADGTQAVTLTLSAASGGAITATASAAIFQPGHVGGLIKVSDGLPGPGLAFANPSGIAKIVAFVNSTTVTLDNASTYQGQAFGSLTYLPLTWGIAQATYGGLSYLNGMTVDMVGDGAYMGTAVVSGGSVTLQTPAVMVEIGLHYDSEADTVRPEIKTQRGSSQGLRRRWTVLVIRLLNTLGLTIGMLRDPADPIQFLDQIEFRQMGPSSSPAGQPPPLFSGDVLKTQLGADRNGQIILKQTQPLPCTITMISGTLEVADEL